MDSNPKDPAKVAVVVQPGYVLLDVAVPQQVFGRQPDWVTACWPGGAPYELTLVSAVPAENPLVPREVEPLDRLDTADTVIVAGVQDPTGSPDAELVQGLRDAYDRGSRMVSICTGAFALAAAGILDGRSATTHWRWAGLLRERHPSVTVREAELYVEDSGVFTSAGVLAGTDLCLHLLRLDHGQAAANRMARFLVSPPHREGGQAQFIEHIPPVGQSQHRRFLMMLKLGRSLGGSTS
ncbi:GlxA family transcriptional regulator [Streptomyces sp. NPDC058656]|uniref:GlxA family transcriptional regulator n=1 Tax=Streptomyces sp. NPDC058656 TaxID=3346578 RepID=UPI003668F8AA